jgi:hypothetical protein
VNRARVGFRAGFVVLVIVLAVTLARREEDAVAIVSSEPPAPAAPRRLAYGESVQIFADTVRLAPGGVRAWDLEAGQYDIAVRPVVRDVLSPLELVADITCATESRDPELIHCVVRTATRFVLRHNGMGPSAGITRAFVSITRLP